MAQPVAYRKFTPAIPAEITEDKLAAAPMEHADAVLNAYRVLQQAHDSGTLDVLAGAMAGGDAIINHVVDLASAPETVVALRNLLLLGKVLGSLNPQILHGALGGLSVEGSQMPNHKAPSLFSLLRRLSSEDARRGLGVAVDLLTAVGHGLAKEQERE